MKTTTFYFGRDLRTSRDEAMQAISSEALFDQIANPGDELDALTTRLRRLAAIDKVAYDQAKKHLPYFCCSRFVDGRRLIKGFEQATGMVLDIDHLDKHEIPMMQLAENLVADERVYILFVSPSGQGIKMVLLFDEPITNPETYREVYKAVARSFMKKYNLKGKIDETTHDVTRICFICTDRQACLNERAQTIKPGQYADPGQQTRLPQPEQGQPGDNTAGTADAPIDDTSGTSAPSGKDYNEILKKLNPKAKIKANNSFVPKILEEVEESIKKAMLEHQFETMNVLNINYGKKFRFSDGTKRAEINVFFGKRGFSVVISPKTGTDIDFSKVAKLIVEKALAGINTGRDIKANTEWLERRRN